MIQPAARTWARILTLALILLVADRLRAAPSLSPTLSPTERQVLRRIAGGEHGADFRGATTMPRLSPDFLSALLRGTLRQDYAKDKNPLDIRLLYGFTVPDEGILIRGIRMTDDFDLQQAVIPYETALEYCDFDGYVKFSNSKFKSHLSFEHSHFNRTAANVTDDPKCPASFDNVTVGGDLFLSSAVFAGPVTFSQTGVAGDLECLGTNFSGTEAMTLPPARPPGGRPDLPDPYEMGHCIADFTDVKVGASATLTDARFHGPANFGGAQISGDFLLGGSKFRSRDLLWDQTNEELNTVSVSFRRIKVGGSLILQEAEFAGPVSLEFGGSPRDLNVRRANFRNQPIVSSLRVGAWDNLGGAKTDLRYLTIGGTAHFDDAYLQHPYVMEGMRYEHISAGDGTDGPLAFINKAVYSADSYAVLEDYYLRHGDAEASDMVFIAHKRRERSLLRSYSLPWLWSGFLYRVSGYGRRPEWALYWSLAFIVYGCFLFRDKRNMTLKTGERGGLAPAYSSFWYSFSLFIPVLDPGGWISRPCSLADSRWHWWQLLYCREMGLLQCRHLTPTAVRDWHLRRLRFRTPERELKPALAAVLHAPSHPCRVDTHSDRDSQHHRQHSLNCTGDAAAPASGPAPFT